MAVMSEANRIATTRQLMSDLSASRMALAAGMTKADLKAAVDAIDVMLTNSESAINATFPQATRDNLTTPQKAMVLMAVTYRRWVVGA